MDTSRRSPLRNIESGEYETALVHLDAAMQALDEDMRPILDSLDKVYTYLDPTQ